MMYGKMGKMGKKEDVMGTPMGKAYAAAKNGKGPKKPMPPAGAAAPMPKAKPMPKSAPKAKKMK